MEAKGATPATPQRARYSLGQLARREGVSTGAVWRWIRSGLTLPTGERIKLGSERTGWRVYVPIAAWEEWSTALAEADRLADAARAAPPKSSQTPAAPRARETAGLVAQDQLRRRLTRGR